jgi:hypothetical protein
MKKDTTNIEHLSIKSRDVLTEVLRRGAQSHRVTAAKLPPPQLATAGRRFDKKPGAMALDCQAFFRIREKFGHDALRRGRGK